MSQPLILLPNYIDSYISHGQGSVPTKDNTDAVVFGAMTQENGNFSDDNIRQMWGR